MQLNRGVGVAVWPGMGGSVDPYAVLAIYKPPLVADFAEEYYRAAGVPTTFSDMLVPNSQGLMILTDSDGLWKWNVHNYRANSENFSNAGWIANGTTKTDASAATDDPDGGATAYRVTQDGATSTHWLFIGSLLPAAITDGVWEISVKADAGGFACLSVGSSATNYASCTVDLSDGSVTANYELGTFSVASTTVVDQGNGWYRVTLKTTGGNALYCVVGPVSAGTYTPSNYGFPSEAGTGESIFVAFAAERDGRLDTVNNPDRTDKYVPTTSAAVYLPRRNAHLYDASVAKWNAHNLLTYSTDMSNAAWTKFRTTGSGTSTFTLTEDTGTDTKYMRSASAVFTSGVLYTFAVEAKPNGRNWLRINPGSGAFPALRDAWFDVATGATGTVEGDVETATIVATTDGFYLCTMTVIADASATEPAVNLVLGEADNDPTYTGDGTSGMIFRKPRVYRTDLNGVVANGDDGTYVATTATAVEPTLNTVSFPKKGLRFERAAAQNIQPYSNELGTVNWTLGATSALDEGAYTGPDGTASLWELRPTSATSGDTSVYYNSGATTTTNQAYTQSWVIRYDNMQYVQIRSFGSSGNYAAAVFDLINGTVTDTTGAGTFTYNSSTIEPLGDGMFRCSLTATTSATITWCRLDGCDSATPTRSALGGIDYTRALTDGWGIGYVQMEKQGAPTSYIPNTGNVTVTRPLEGCTIAGALLPANTTGMSIKMKGLLTHNTQVNEFFYDWVVDADNEIQSYIKNDTNLDAYQETAAVLDFSRLASAYSFGVNIPYNTAAAYTSGRVQSVVDGVLGTVNTTPTALFDGSATVMSFGGSTSDEFNGFISEFVMWGEDITDAGLQAATAQG